MTSFISTITWLISGLALFLLAFALGWIASRVDFRADNTLEVKRKALLVEVRAAMLSTNPKWPELVRLASTLQLGTSDLYTALVSLERSVLTGQDNDLLPLRDIISSHIQTYNALEPFARVPERVRVQLYKVQTQLPQGSDALQTLSLEIEELAAVNMEERIRERRRSYQAYIVGLIGFILAIIAFLFPTLGPSLAQAVIPAAQVVVK
jgi:hypothetical protein